jgi:hypothetical protein
VPEVAMFVNKNYRFDSEFLRFFFDGFRCLCPGFTVGAAPSKIMTLPAGLPGLQKVKVDTVAFWG